MLSMSIYEGTGEGEFNRIEVNGELVLTTLQISQKFNCSTNNIKKIFHSHKDNFIEGEHYFKLVGEDLKNFKRNVGCDSRVTKSNLVTNGNLLIVNPNASALILWSMLGVARFAKSLRTKRAWEIYELLAASYFKSEKSEPKISQCSLNAEKKIKFLLQAAKITKDSKKREKLIDIVEKIINES